MECSEVVLFLMVCTAVVTDIRTGKIKNWLTLPAVAVAPLIHLLQTGKHGALLSLEGIGVMVLISALLISLRLFGGGDVKLLVAVGGLVTLPLVGKVLLYTALAGGVLALVVALRRNMTTAVAREIGQAVWYRCFLGIAGPERVSAKTRMPYAVAIAAGSIAAVVASGQVVG